MRFKLIFVIITLPLFSLGQKANLSILTNTTFGSHKIVKGFSSYKGLDDLNNYNTDNLFFKISNSFFYKERFGIELTYQGNLTSKQKYSDFKNMIESRYPDYYISYDHLVNDNEISLSTSSFFIGPIYKFEHNKIHFTYKILFGGSYLLNIDTVSVLLKKKNGNELISEKFARDNNHGLFNISTGINLFYIIYKGIGVNFEVNYIQTIVRSKDLNYTIISTNLDTGVENRSKVSYHQTLKAFSLGIGICYYVKLGTPK